MFYKQSLQLCEWLQRIEYHMQLNSSMDCPIQTENWNFKDEFLNFNFFDRQQGTQPHLTIRRMAAQRPHFLHRWRSI